MIDEILAVGAGRQGGALDEAEVRARCDSPRFRRGLLVPDDATVQPARLALGLRARLLERASRSSSARASGRCARTPAASSPRPQAGACAPAPRSSPSTPPRAGFGPLRPRLGHLVAHRADRAGARTCSRRSAGPGESASPTRRTFVHYFRTTRDGRIVFGWGGGRLAAGARLGGRVEVDAAVAEEIRRHLVDDVPGAARGARSPTPGAARSTSRRATCRRSARSTARPVHYAFGFTGNGVGPSHLAGRVLAALASGERPTLASSIPARPRAAGAVRLGRRNARPPCLFT